MKNTPAIRLSIITYKTARNVGRKRVAGKSVKYREYSHGAAVHTV